MATAESRISDMLITVKSREIQRGLQAQMRKDLGAATRHLLAAAHLELVLADDYTSAGMKALALRSRFSAASCFWRAGETKEAKQLFDAMRRDYPEQAAEIKRVIAELKR